MSAIDRVIDTMAKLRGPGGCPWDREQTFESLRTYLLEESYEVAEAIDTGDRAALGEELGDLLLQIVFLCQIAAEDGAFGFEQVATGLADKLVRRHPHVFGEEHAESTAEAWQHWENAKAREQDATRSRMDGLPQSMPALIRAHRIAERAARAGFAWPNATAVAKKVDEEVCEVRAALERGEHGAIEEEIGDLLFACASLSQTAKVDPERALQKANKKFVARFREVERLARMSGQSLDRMTPAQLDTLWCRSKRA